VIAGLLPASRRTVDSGRLERFRQQRAEQRMVNADAGVALERVPPIMPEGVDPLVGMKLAQRVGPPLRDQLAISLARFRRE
jgi:hypothetical protein